MKLSGYGPDDYLGAFSRFVKGGRHEKRPPRGVEKSMLILKRVRMRRKKGV